MLRVALTGGIATGKSYVRRALEDRGVSCIDADAVVHQALGPGTPATAAILKRFGPSMIGPDGSVDRSRLGAVVFADAAARRDLEALVHPLVYDRIARWLAEGVRRGDPLRVAEIPLLYETGHADDFDVVVLAACPRREQLARMKSRDGLSDVEAARRLEAQWAIDRKVAQADHVVWTSDSFEDTDRQVDDVVQALRRRADRPTRRRSGESPSPTR